MGGGRVGLLLLHQTHEQRLILEVLQRDIATVAHAQRTLLRMQSGSVRMAAVRERARPPAPRSRRRRPQRALASLHVPPHAALHGQQQGAHHPQHAADVDEDGEVSAAARTPAVLVLRRPSAAEVVG